MKVDIICYDYAYSRFTGNIRAAIAKQKLILISLITFLTFPFYAHFIHLFYYSTIMPTVESLTELIANSSALETRKVCAQIEVRLQL